jgi:hypothetical protein
MLGAVATTERTEPAPAAVCVLHREPDLGCADCRAEIERRAAEAATLVANDIEVGIGPW